MIDAHVKDFGQIGDFAHLNESSKVLLAGMAARREHESTWPSLGHVLDRGHVGRLLRLGQGFTQRQPPLIGWANLNRADHRAGQEP
jgi:hypothetical protein